jgi:hypothetical protein
VAEHRGKLGLQDLECDLALVFEIFGEIHRRHPAGTKLVFDGVAVGEGGLETVERIVHEGSRRAMSMFAA